VSLYAVRSEGTSVGTGLSKSDAIVGPSGEGCLVVGALAMAAGGAI
jgi:hypothetical protein